MAEEDNRSLSVSSKTSTGRRSIVTSSVGDLLDSVGVGNPNKVITRQMYGLNHGGGELPLPPSRNSNGFILFTRPLLNLSSGNLRNVRKFYSLLNKNPVSVARFVRATLDPRLGLPKMKDQEHLKCPLVDNKQAFIPLLSNSIKNANGWPDKVVPKFVSEPNRFKNTYQQVDGMTNLKEPMTLDLTCRNTMGDPLFHLMDVWTDYMMLVHSGELEPYPDMIIRNEKDYETRAFRIVLDKTNTFLVKIASTLPGFVEGNTQGSFYDYDTEKPYVDGNDEMSLRFSFPGVEYEDPILIKEFNETVSAFNPDMREENMSRAMKKVDRGDRNLVMNRGYPRINEETLEFEIWITNEVNANVTQRNQNEKLILT